MSKWVGPHPSGGRCVCESEGVVEAEGGGWLPVDGGAAFVSHVSAQQIQRDVLQTAIESRAKQIKSKQRRAIAIQEHVVRELVRLELGQGWVRVKAS